MEPTTVPENLSSNGHTGGAEPAHAAVVPYRTYSEVVGVEALLALKQDVGGLPDGVFFVAVHQVYEIWFMVVLHELELARAAIDADDVHEACARLRRVKSVEEVLVAQLSTLETLTAGQFAMIRPHLGTASGFQSVQFREIEFLSGAQDPSHLNRGDLSDLERERLARRLNEPTLADSFDAFIARRGEVDLVEATRSGQPADVVALIECLLDHDEACAAWRGRHTLLVERMIGHKHGTGGSEGVEFLSPRVNRRFFPRLWELRSQL